MPSPPSLNGKQIDCQATFAPVWVREDPFHKKAEKILSSFLIVVRGRMNREVQYTCIENKTDLISCKRPAYVREDDVHSLILEVIRSINGTQSACVSLVEMRGTPRYLIGRVPGWIPNWLHMLCFRSSSTPDKYKELLAWLIVSPERRENLSMQDFNMPTDSASAWQ
jgi:hypothetical protein